MRRGGSGARRKGGPYTRLMKRLCSACGTAFWLPVYRAIRPGDPLPSSDPTCPNCGAPAPTATNAYVALVVAVWSGIGGIVLAVISVLVVLASPNASNDAALFALLALSGVPLFLVVAAIERIRGR